MCWESQGALIVLPDNASVEKIRCPLLIPGVIIRIMTDEFKDLTIRYLEDTDIAYRKSKGQYFTPKPIREELLCRLPKKMTNPKVLDPACGTGEFLISANERFRNARLYGWDIDRKLIEISKKLAPHADFKVTDALKEEARGSYDIVIGNPPYYEFSPDGRTRERFGDIINGRTNIFSLFIKLGLELLKEGGYLAYVVPPSMNNGAYFFKVRKYIIENSNIEYLKILNDTSLFNKALQMTMLLVLKKGANKGDYIFKENGVLILAEDPEYLRRSFKGKACLRDLGFTVRTGRLVWNQNKEYLTNDSREGIPLIWAHNITPKGLNITVKHRKPQYVKIKECNTGPAIVVNRITGAAKSARLRAAIIPEGMKFIAENHCNVIFPPRQRDRLKMDFIGKKGKISLEDVVTQLESPKKLKVMQNITGNTQISKTELERLFPIDIA